MTNLFLLNRFLSKLTSKQTKYFSQHYLIILSLSASILLSSCGSDSSVDTSNKQPVAVATVANNNVTQNTSVTLDGNSSTDPNGDTLSYIWSFESVPLNSNAVILNPTNASTSFIADLPGEYVFQLIVNDGVMDSTPTVLTVTVSTPTQCSTLKASFLSDVWPILSSKCLGCHEEGFASNPLKFVADTISGFNDTNFTMFKNISNKKDGSNVSIMLTKPANTNGDHAGGVQFSVADPGYTAFADMVARAATCVVDTVNNPADIILNTRYERLRKITFALAGRLPTAAEEALIKNAPNETALENAMDTHLDTLLTENGFYTRLKRIYNDLLLTNAFAGTFALDNFDLSNFDNQDYFTAQSLNQNGYAGVANDSDRNLIRRNANVGLERAPLELIANVVRKGAPFTEILTANYVMVNPYSAQLFGTTTLTNFKFNYGENIAANKPNEFREAILKDNTGRTYPHAGILNTLGFLTRYASTPTNLNRARSRVVYKYFLDKDVEGLVDRASLDLDNVIGLFPTFIDPQCTACHNVIDPIAGTFKNWTDTGPFGGNRRDWPNTPTPPEMLPPGFSQTDTLPAARSATALQWLAGRIIASKDFSTATVKTIFSGLTGRQPADSETLFIEELIVKFQNDAGGFDLKRLIKNIVNSTTFHANNLAESENPALFADVGMGRLLTPEQLNDKIMAIAGNYEWKSPSGRNLFARDTYLLLYGGIDSNDVVTRTTKPSPIMAGIQNRIARQTSCETVPKDFAKGAANRIYFPFVEMTDTPMSTNGPANIKQNIQYLHKRILGEELDINGTDGVITDSYNLFTSIWNAALADNIPIKCRANLGVQNPVINDANRTVKSWMAFVAYLFLDYKFLYE